MGKGWGDKKKGDKSRNWLERKSPLSPREEVARGLEDTSPLVPTRPGPEPRCLVPSDRSQVGLRSVEGAESRGGERNGGGGRPSHPASPSPAPPRDPYHFCSHHRPSRGRLTSGLPARRFQGGSGGGSARPPTSGGHSPFIWEGDDE